MSASIRRAKLHAIAARIRQVAPDYGVDPSIPKPTWAGDDFYTLSPTLVSDAAYLDNLAESLEDPE